MNGVIPISTNTYNLWNMRTIHKLAETYNQKQVKRSFSTPTQPILASLGAKSIATEPTNTLSVRMAGVWARKGAYGAHIPKIVGICPSRNNPIHLMRVRCGLPRCGVSQCALVENLNHTPGIREAIMHWHSIIRLTRFDNCTKFK